jgi:parallel beta-helix repeat protein
LKNKCLIEENIIQGSGVNSTEDGIKIGLGSRPRIFNNQITKVAHGIYTVSCDATIIRNYITNCKTGIVSKTFDSYISETKIKLNMIKNCEENGILVSGKNNNTIILQNIEICQNNKAGIRVEN